jgi:hypothetical protein
MTAPGHLAGYPDQDSYAYGDGENDQRAMLDLARHPVQCIVADLGAVLGSFIAETRGFLAGQAPAATKTTDEFGHGRSDGVAEVIAGGGHADRGAPARCSSDLFKLLFQGAHATLDSGDVSCKCR